jgi:glycogen phosphorylase
MQRSAAVESRGRRVVRLAAFNLGDYDKAVEEKVASETITKVLYPNHEAHRGKELRLKQQFFFTSCSLQDMLHIHALLGGTPANFHQNWAVQLNDTHPTIAVAELMRLLLDEQGLAWEQAWAITRSTFAYTNHTLLPEALEKWSVDLFGALLPRHLEIIFELNRRSSMKFARPIQATSPALRGFRSLTKAEHATCAWHISRASAVTP